MVLREKDANAQILRNFIDFSTKSNQFFLTNLSQVISDALDQIECSGEALRKISAREGVELLLRNYRLSNLEIAYILILTTRGYRFRVVTERVFLCEEKAIFPDFERLPPLRPKLSDNFETKTAVLDAILECQEKDSDELLTTIVRSIPELLEKVYGLLYTGKYLSINEWIQIKEDEGEWISEEILRCDNNNIKPWMLANLLVLQARGWYFQEIPEKFKGSDYVFIKK
ncbi:MAG: hypothetical protein KAS63_04255 [Candidatus Heimdallarchaeota archaeon]|nr:hypothetical protein [Candidatus Heimdallarchaeota archaeon]MCK4954548.1 hypothetical protein [Candidatus Heimdallarchaeota archaeon]